MSDWITQETRKAQNMTAAVEALRDSGMPTPRTDEAEMEPIIGDDHRLAALVGDLAESYARLSRALDHVDTHVVASQDKEIERMQKRVDKLENTAKPKAPAKP
jgi:hypothetical protein